MSKRTGLGARGIAAVAGSLVVGCSSPPVDIVAAREIPAAMQADVAAVVEANNTFATDAYQRLVATDPGSNLVFSPFSIATAFSMLDAGAAGQSDAELRATLHMTLPGERAHAAYGAILESLATGRSFGQYTLATANKLFGQDGYPFLDPFLAITRDDYNAELASVDFIHDAAGATETIDHWVSDQTDSKIPMLFEPGEIDDMARLVLVNAILFKGTWAQHFDHDATHDGSFFKADGSTVQATLMSKEESIRIGAIPDGTIGVMPFAGNDIDMVILLPSEVDGLPALEAQLTGASIGEWVAGASQANEPTVILPKFAVSSQPELMMLMTSLGIPSLFDPDAADLSGIVSPEVDRPYVSNAVHQAMITVDEDGAEAAAATGVVVGADSASASVPFQVDHPFIFILHDAVTGSILFMGRVTDPTL